ncbi:acetyl-CoA carboxylase biotin carboxyl carrier protein subunit, partial [Pseudolysinimonas sp.]|uniref:acetyl-CoA carboxylase biotin carboxyl carrier protein subunit n=1 Tax=Pseudolysinimonas sp. TaxID=2680009 RepID=UPI00286B09CD
AGLAVDALVAVERVPGGHVVWLHRDGRTVELPVPTRAERLTRALAVIDRSTGPAAPELRAAMPGTVVMLAVDDGAHVESGATVLSVEAMKMEHALVAPHSGTVRLRVRSGELVRLDQVVAVVEPDLEPEQQEMKSA